MARTELTEQERACLTQLVVEHQAEVRMFLCRRVSRWSVVEDICQEVFVGVVDRCVELCEREPRERAAYLRGVAANLMRMYWRGRKTEEKHLTRAADYYVQEQMAAEAEEDPEEASERMRALKSCMERLAERARSMVQEHFFEGTQLKQMAQRMGYSEDALRMTMMRVRRILKRCVEARVGEGLAR